LELQKAPVNKILPLSVVDGSGARSVVFLQGCNLTCLYCHNPETQQLCNHCGHCISICPSRALTLVESAVFWQPDRCEDCDACINICPHFSSPKIRTLSALEVFSEIQPNLPFLRGITVSGGECTLYSPFVSELFSLAKGHGLHCLIDSNGMTDFSTLLDLMAVTDGVMLDVKAWDTQVYKALTGAGSNEIVRNNLQFLANEEKLAELRIVALPNYVDASAVLHGTAKLLGAQVAHIPLKLIAFRPIGVRDSLADTKPPVLGYMQTLQAVAYSLGYKNVRLV